MLLSMNIARMKEESVKGWSEIMSSGLGLFKWDSQPRRDIKQAIGNTGLELRADI